jgi:putative ABC transport system substrate-binding protein
MRRRDFIAGAGAAVWPLSARSQQTERVRRIGALMGWSESDPEYHSWLAAFVQRLAQLGWLVGRNVRIEQRWTDGDVDRTLAFAKELVSQQPDVILASTTPATAALHQQTRSIPIVFGAMSDPVGAGLAGSLSQPGGNVTGFINVEAAMGGKWLGLLKEIAPHIGRAAIMFNPDTAPGGGSYFLDSFQAAGRSLAMDTFITRVRSDAAIETAITALGREHAGVVLMTDSFIGVRRKLVISLCARNNVPAIFEPPFFAQEGGLMSYGVNYPDLFRRAAGYVDRILQGAKPAELPIEVPTKFYLIINLNTAKALGLTVPNTLLASADEVIE